MTRRRVKCSAPRVCPYPGCGGGGGHTDQKCGASESTRHVFAHIWACRGTNPAACPAFPVWGLPTFWGVPVDSMWGGLNKNTPLFANNTRHSPFGVGQAFLGVPVDLRWMCGSTTRHIKINAPRVCPHLGRARWTHDTPHATCCPMFGHTLAGIQPAFCTFPVRRTVVSLGTAVVW